MGQVCHKHCPPEGGTALVLIGGAVVVAAVVYGVVQAITSAVFLTAAVVVLSAAIFAGVACVVREVRRSHVPRPGAAAADLRRRPGRADAGAGGTRRSRAARSPGAADGAARLRARAARRGRPVSTLEHAAEFAVIILALGGVVGVEEIWRERWRKRRRTRKEVKPPEK